MADRSQQPPGLRTRKRDDWQLYARLLNHAAPYWWALLLSFAGFALYSLGVVLFADLLQFLLDAIGNASSGQRGVVAFWVGKLYPSVLAGDIESLRVVVPVAIVVVALVRAAGFFCGNYCMDFVARHVVSALRCGVFEKLLNVPCSYIDRHGQGELISRITFNVEQVAGACTKALKTLLRETLIVIGLLGYMVYLNWRLCLVFLLVAPAIYVIVRFVGRHFRRYSRRIQSSMGQVTQIAADTVAANRELRVYAGQSEQTARFATANSYNLTQSLKLAFADALSTPVLQLILALALAMLVWMLLKPEVLAGFTPGSLMAFLVAAGQLGKPVRQLSGVQSIVQRGLAAADDIFTQIDEPQEADCGTYSIARVRGDVACRNLTFSYPGSSRPALIDVSLDIKAGETVAIVGPSGSGKSTLALLLLRLYGAPPGSILLDGVPIEDYDLACLRRQIAVVPQAPALLRANVYDNIAFGAMAGASRDSVLRAADVAQASDFIAALPAGIKTPLGEGGTGLSGGQCQRIAIARAILKDAPILIMDEGTSALDAESEFRVRTAMAAVMAGRTTLVIAHRLETVEHADLIVVMSGGRIVARGQHAQLLADGGLYAELYRRDFTN